MSTMRSFSTGRPRIGSPRALGGGPRARPPPESRELGVVARDLQGQRDLARPAGSSLIGRVENVADVGRHQYFLSAGTYVPSFTGLNASPIQPSGSRDTSGSLRPVSSS